MDKQTYLEYMVSKLTERDIEVLDMVYDKGVFHVSEIIPSKRGDKFFKNAESDSEITEEKYSIKMVELNAIRNSLDALGLMGFIHNIGSTERNSFAGGANRLTPMGFEAYQLIHNK